jgi:hypothetical protein
MHGRIIPHAISDKKDERRLAGSEAGWVEYSQGGETLDKALENAGSFEAAGFSLEISSSVPPYWRCKTP